MTLEGLTFIWKLLTISALLGFSGIGGVWCFCKLTRWAPVNITVNITKTDDIID